MENHYFRGSGNISHERSTYLEENRQILVRVLYYQIKLLNLRALVPIDKSLTGLFYATEKLEKKSANNFNNKEVNKLIRYLLEWLDKDDVIENVTNPIDYLYELSREFYETRYDLEFLRKVLYDRSNKVFNSGMDEVEYVNVEKEEIDALFNALINVPETEKNQIIKARIGQGRFRRELIKKSCKCALCGISNVRLLIASHIKPWCECANVEKLSMDNGLLLCPNHDWLFDKGFITISETGSLIISKDLDENSQKLFNVHSSINFTFDKKQETYIKWHRNHIFKDGELVGKEL